MEDKTLEEDVGDEDEPNICDSHKDLRARMTPRISRIGSLSP